MTIELDDCPPEELIHDIKSLDNIYNAILIKAL